jgi:hypothetical protein
MQRGHRLLPECLGYPINDFLTASMICDNLALSTLPHDFLFNAEAFILKFLSIIA